MTPDMFGWWLELFEMIMIRDAEAEGARETDQYDWMCGRADATSFILEKWHEVKRDA